MNGQTMHQRNSYRRTRDVINAMLKSGEMSLRIADCTDDYLGIAEMRAHLREEGALLAADALGTNAVRYAYPVLTYLGKDYAGGCCAISHDPSYGVLSPMDAVMDSFFGGQFDDLHAILFP